jgi:hypothetical protein
MQRRLILRACTRVRGALAALIQHSVASLVLLASMVGVFRVSVVSAAPMQPRSGRIIALLLRRHMLSTMLLFNQGFLMMQFSFVLFVAAACCTGLDKASRKHCI